MSATVVHCFFALPLFICVLFLYASLLLYAFLLRGLGPRVSLWVINFGVMGVTEKGLTPTGVNSLPSISLFCRHTRIHLQNFKPLNILLLSQVL